MSSFPFITDKILRSNLDTTLSYIASLIAISESGKFTSSKDLISSLRKTIIIHTASIVEALILWKLKKYETEMPINISQEWKYFDIKVLDSCNIDYEVIAGKRKRVNRDLDKLDLFRLIDYLHKYINIDSRLYKRLTKLRELRNKLHIGSLSVVDNSYSKADIEFAFEVAREIKELCKTNF